MASQFQSNLDWNYGNAIHYSNILLGRLALARDQVGIASRYLLRAAAIDGSPQLSDYGPDMTLAQELLWCGESSVVLQYFERCGRFWRNAEKNRLQEWSDAVCVGDAPHFGTRSGLNPTRWPR
jgi:hypothetical protein